MWKSGRWRACDRYVRPSRFSDPSEAPGLVEHFFRREHGRLVAILTRRVGVRHVELVEDAVQTALMTALTSWVAKGLPEDPGAWLYRVAHNHLIGALRNDARGCGYSRLPLMT